jgi:hypothetical protein
MPVNAGEFSPVSDYTIFKEFYSPRDDGNKNEDKMLRYIADFCDEFDLDYKIDAVDDGDTIISRSSNITVTLQGSGKEQDQLIFICPLDNPVIHQQYHDNSLSIFIMLELILKVRKISLTKDILFVFSGANENMRNTRLGIDYFVADSENLSNAFITVIDILSSGRDIQFTGSSNRKPVSMHVLQTFRRLSSNLPYLFFDESEIPKSRMMLLDRENYVSHFASYGYTAVEFTNRASADSPSFTYEEEKSRELTELLYNWLLAYDTLPFPMEEDRHYLYTQLGRFYLFISEHIQVLLFLILILLTIITRFFFPQFQKFHLQLFIKIIPFFLLLLVIFWITSFLPTIVMMIFGLLTKIQNFQFRFPILYLFNIFLIPQLTLFILYELLNRLKFPKHNHLYMYGAIIIAFLNLVIVSFIDISFSYLYVWVILVLTLSQFTGKRFFLKLLLYSIAPLPFFKLLADLTMFGSFSFFEQANPLVVNSLITWFGFPFVLLNIRINIIYRARFRIFFSKTAFSLIMITSIMVSMVLLFIVSWNSSLGDEILEVICRVDKRTQISRLELEADNPVGDITLVTGDFTTSLKVDDAVSTIPLNEMMETPYTIYSWKEQQPDYLDYFITINSEEEIEYLEIFMETEASFYPLEANFAWEDITENSAEDETATFKFKLPRLPGKRIPFKVSLFPGIIHTFTVKLYYQVLPGIRLVPEKENLVVHTYSIFIEDRQVR